MGDANESAEVIRRLLVRPFRPLLEIPFIRRVAFHGRRISEEMDVHFFRTLSISVLVIVVVSSIVVSLAEADKREFGEVGNTVYWAVTTVIGSGDSSYVDTPGGFVIGWLLAFFGVAIVAALTAAVVGFVIDFLLKEGQGMGASGFQDHIVVCGWNSTARELVDELRGDEFPAKVVLLHTAEHNPAGSGVYYVRGDATSGDDLERAGTREAASAIVFPLDATDEADMRSILVILAIESITPDVRTVVEVNNPKHVAHFKRAKANEILVTSRLASRLLARSALYPGMAGLVTDIVSGGEGSELYHVEVPEAYLDLTIDQLSAALRADHNATLLAVTRDGVSMTNPSSDFRLLAGDDAVVLAESLGDLVPIEAAGGVTYETR